MVGVKGSVMTRFGGYGYDLFAGTPVYKPSGFPTARVTVGFQLTAQFNCVTGARRSGDSGNGSRRSSRRLRGTA